MAPKIVDKEAKKQQILEAAMKVFAEHGVQQTKIADIALEANIGKGTIYEYFRSKDEIFVAAYHYFMQDLETKLGTELVKISDPCEQLRMLFQLSTDTFIKASDFAHIMMDFWAEGIRSRDKAEVDRLFDLRAMYCMYRNVIQDILEAGVAEGAFRELDTANLATVLVGWLDGLFLQWFIDPHEVDLQAAIDVFIDGLFLGILSSNSRSEFKPNEATF